MSKTIETIFEKYLKKGANDLLNLKLRQALDEAGLLEEAKAWNHQTKKEIGISLKIEWGGKLRECFVGPFMPLSALPGDLWFDTVELTFMVLIPNPESAALEHACWISTHPVYMWQFLTFMRLANWHPYKTSFLKVDDLMCASRFENPNFMSYATNIYHEEAVAYAAWFGKSLCSQIHLEFAKEFLDTNSFYKILPYKLRLWDQRECSLSEFIRIAPGHDSINTDAEEELYLLEAGELDQPSLLTDEWERSEHIGLTTAVPFGVGLLRRLPRLGYEFIELENHARRQ